jgi:hypothetical protein
MFSSRMKLALVTGFSVIAVGAYATDAVQQDPIAAEVAPGEQVEAPQYGPILSNDPETIVEIKSLYDGERAAMAQLELQIDGIRAELATLEDFEARQAKQREGGDIRQQMMRTHIEFGLDIARLNEDEHRIAEFERALDFMNNPERYRPAPVHVDRGN